MKIKKFSLLIISLAVMGFSSCKNSNSNADLIVHNAVIYTVDSAFSTAQSIAVKDGKILAVGSNDDILSKYESKEKLDAEGKAIYPGFIDAHCHFYSYGMGLQRANLVGTKSFNEVLELVQKYHQENPSEWVIGRGWDQNDWEVKEYPDKAKLDSLFPTTPVLLKRVDGHAALANSEALKRANVTALTKVEGGKIELKHSADNSYPNLVKVEPSGILVDNAIDFVSKVIPKPSAAQQLKALLTAQKNCFEVGLTTIDDAGLDKAVVDLIDSLQKAEKLKMRIYAMLTPNDENLNHFLQKGPYKTDKLNVRSFKFYGDGALGSRGAALMQAYSDKPEEKGFLLQQPGYYIKHAQQMYDKGFQMCTHCIGDSANRLILEIYGSILKGKNDKRWRIEHAQVVNKDDFKKFGDFSIIPSVQPTHATSDMEWAKDRLGEERVKGAYAWKEFIKNAGMIAAGSDFPVEDINPLYGFYAAVVRKDLKGNPENGYQMENAISREEALKAMTIWAAFSNFEENEKGSITPGKFADFVILDQDIMKASEKELPNIKVLYTFINGEKVFEGKK